ncbi:MAG: branched-chain amino acid ABC transporter permease [Gammaproteobacteria bacterium]|nr:branched-chain amino acid ABC transporter permease [Gammaproteobacteria bacterium]NIR83118.1 branched-chain amino acid ABC transporter permease [Gammaproteobacteria bacterium]NIR90780.1 branched-chain amino acid ABC transporter permease [Gammaproteobacteria bacterium]NIU04271.1 branched-chain amino acid ABC transporter permease [Gammaproteobacteria bacterium]NIV51563.1 branched-chain amino acid ABC transporter permease [Gammaproteobacteria bacterium]
MYFVTLTTLILLYGILALSLNLITGLAGQVSLGHAAFFGIGAYTLAYLMTLGVDFWAALAAAGAAAGLAGLLLGAVSLRLREDYLAIATIALNFVVVALLLYLPYFGGAFGISNIASPFGSVGTGIMVLVAFVIVIVVHERIRWSDLGLALMAVKESEDAAQALGVDVRRFKMTAFAIGTAIAGVAGGLYAVYIGVIHPEDFGFPLSVTLLAMVAIGGMGTLWGPLLGALVLGGFSQAFAFVQNYQLVLFGLLLALVMRYRPQGVVGRAW